MIVALMASLYPDGRNEEQLATRRRHSTKTTLKGGDGSTADDHEDSEVKRWYWMRGSKMSKLLVQFAMPCKSTCVCLEHGASACWCWGWGTGALARMLLCICEVCE